MSPHDTQTVWWLSSHTMTVGVVVDRAQRIQSAPPIISRFTGQPVRHLLRWMQRHGGFRARRIGAETTVNPDHTTLCRKCHKPVVRAQDMQGRIVVIEPYEPIYIWTQLGNKIVTERVQRAGIKHVCPGEKTADKKHLP